MRARATRTPAEAGRIDRPRRRAALGAVAAVAALAACSVSPRAADPPIDAPAAPTAPQTADGLRIPPDDLPPPGQCRVWMPDDPARTSAETAGGRCSRLRETIPAGAWLVYRPTDDPKVIRVWGYGEERQVLWQRIYDAATGELIRHVAPLGS